MDTFLREFIYKKLKIGTFEVTFLDLLLALCVSGTGVLLRLSVLEYTPTDLQKILAMILDYVMAVFAGVVVWNYTGHRNRAFMTYAIMTIYPTMIANSALWAKNSSFYGILFLLCIYTYVKGMKLLSGGFLAAGMFLWAISMTPGSVIMDTETLALQDQLTWGWPNIFEIVGKGMFVDLFQKAAWLFILGVVLCVVYAMLRMKIMLTKELFLPLFLFMLLFIPYFAPGMPAWAGYTADVAALVYAMVYPKRFYIPMLHIVVSYSAYANVMNGETKLPMPFYAVLLLLLIVSVGIDVYKKCMIEVR